MTLAEKMAAIRDRLDGVTPGPWKHDMTNVGKSDHYCYQLVQSGEDGWRGGTPIYVECDGSYGRGEATASYIARLDPQTVAEILDRYERMEKALNKAIYLIDAMMTNDPNEPVSDAGHVVSDLWAHDFKEIRKALGGNDD